MTFRRALACGAFVAAMSVAIAAFAQSPAPSNMLNGAGSTTGTGATTVIPAQLSGPGAGFRIFVTSLQCANTSATNVAVTFDDEGGVVLALPANNSVTVQFGAAPMIVPPNNALTFTSSAGATTITCAAQGYRSFL